MTRKFIMQPSNVYLSPDGQRIVLSDEKYYKKWYPGIQPIVDLGIQPYGQWTGGQNRDIIHKDNKQGIYPIPNQMMMNSYPIPSLPLPLPIRSRF